MRKQGTIVRWQDDRGFGFIRSPGQSQEIFFHIKEFRSHGLAPAEGMRVTFGDVHVGGKGPRAVAVQPLEAAPAPAGPARLAPRYVSRRPERHRRPVRSTPSDSGSGAGIALLFMLGYAAALGWGTWTKLLPVWVILALPFLNLLTFFAYWQDKWAAQKKQWRIKEDTLHLWSLAGGWPGAWFAQQILRHKSRKASFRDTYWMTVVLNCGALGFWLWHRSNQP
jgi:uncharacterized membrane protein YsdA (DUF1294 family)/cold shock CspA family protein